MMSPCDLAVYVFFIVLQALYFYSFPVPYNRRDAFKVRLDRRKMETIDEQSTNGMSEGSETRCYCLWWTWFRNDASCVWIISGDWKSGGLARSLHWRGPFKVTLHHPSMTRADSYLLQSALIGFSFLNRTLASWLDMRQRLKSQRGMHI